MMVCTSAVWLPARISGLSLWTLELSSLPKSGNCPMSSSLRSVCNSGNGFAFTLDISLGLNFLSMSESVISTFLSLCFLKFWLILSFTICTVLEGMDYGAVGEELLHQCNCRSQQWKFSGGHVQRSCLSFQTSLFCQPCIFLPPFCLLLPGTSYTQQSYKVSDSFPFKWINKKWREGFYVTSMATAGSRWGVVMSRNAGFSDQV